MSTLPPPPPSPPSPSSSTSSTSREEKGGENSDLMANLDEIDLEIKIDEPIDVDAMLAEWKKSIAKGTEQELGKTYGEIFLAARSPSLPDPTQGAHALLYVCTCGRPRSYQQMTARCGCSLYRINPHCCEGCAENAAASARREQKKLANLLPSGKEEAQPVRHSENCGRQTSIITLDITSCCDSQGELTPTVDDYLVLTILHREHCYCYKECCKQKDHLLDAGVWFNEEGIGFGGPQSAFLSTKAKAKSDEVE
jgi:hypothetical protein